VGESRAGTAAKERLRSADPRVDRREGNRASRRPAPHRVGVRQSTAGRDAPAVRSHGDLRYGQALRWQSAQARSRSRHTVQHVYPRWAAADANRAPPVKRRSMR
jgi:hypothetical protein